MQIEFIEEVKKPLPDNLLFISAQPLDEYFAWQVEVQIVNFREHGISDRMHILVWYPEDKKKGLQIWRNIQLKYPEVNIFFYKDQGVNLGLYIPQLRPHILKRHFYLYNEDFKDTIFFYHDADIIFRQLPDFASLAEDEYVYESDTVSYVGSHYLQYKAEEAGLDKNHVVNGLAELVGLDPEIIEFNNDNSGGAQYLLKNIDYKFWDGVERDSLAIRSYLFHGVKGSINNKYFKTEQAGYQSWCADMWAVNFNLWKRGINTKISKELDFSWATDSLETYNKKNIFHNAGATSGNPKVFFKGDFINTMPYEADHSQVSPDSASYQYVQSIKKVVLN